jgi:hypothetical protein
MLCFLLLVVANIGNFHLTKSHDKQGFNRQTDFFLVKFIDGIKIALMLSKKNKNLEK